MKIPNRAVLTLALFCILLAGCVRQQIYRTNFRAQQYDPKSTKTADAVIEPAPNYTLGFVEFDDQGWFYGTNRSRNRIQVDSVVNRLSDEAKTNGLLIVTFVHGWKHNAGGGDSNVVMFHKVLDQLGVMEHFLSQKQHHPPRRVVGVYVGWRGLVSDIEPFKEISFWDRKNTAEVVGHGAVVELLSKLEALRNRVNRECKTEIANRQRMTTKLLIIGHSFGGDIVYSAVAPVLTERMVENTDEAGTPQPPKALGDLVVLINPAFEAARFETIQRLATTQQFPPGTNCTLAIFTSKADWATGLAFPIGRRISTVFDTYENNEQKRANITAVGHYDPFINYDLSVIAKTKGSKTLGAPTNEVSPVESSDKVLSIRAQIQRTVKQLTATTNDLTYTFTHCQLTPRPNCIRTDPVFNVAVDRSIIPSHDKIDNGVFIRFLSEFLSAFSSSGEK